MSRILEIMLGRPWWGMLAQGADAGLGGAPSTGSTTPPPVGGGGMLDGVYEVDFVVVSALVGVVVILALVYLIRRLVPPGSSARR